MRGHVVITASNAESGVKLLREGGIDVVIIHHEEVSVTSTLVAGLEKLPDPPPFVMVSSAVDAPTLVTTANAVGAYSNSGEQRASKNTPAVTIVAAWISAETGVGPSIASGSQT